MNKGQRKGWALLVFKSSPAAVLVACGEVELLNYFFAARITIVKTIRLKYKITVIFGCGLIYF